MRRTTIVLAVTALSALALAGCDDFQSRSPDGYAESQPMEEPVAPSAEDAGQPVVAPEVTDPAPTPAPDTLPPEKRSSEESVQPESETLFY